MKTATIEQSGDTRDAPVMLGLYQRLAKVMEDVGQVKATGKTAQNEKTMSIADVEDALRPLLARHGVITGYRWNSLPVVVGQEGKLTIWQADLTVWIRSTDSAEYFEDRICDIGSSPSAAVSFALKRYFRALFHLADEQDEARSATVSRPVRSKDSGAGPAPGSLPGPSTPRPVAPPAPEAPSVEAPETRAQAMIRLMAALKKSGLATADLRKRAGEMFGKTSANELTDVELIGLADEIEGLILATGQAGASA